MPFPWVLSLGTREPGPPVPFVKKSQPELPPPNPFLSTQILQPTAEHPGPSSVISLPRNLSFHPTCLSRGRHPSTPTNTDWSKGRQPEGRRQQPDPPTSRGGGGSVPIPWIPPPLPPRGYLVPGPRRSSGAPRASGTRQSHQRPLPSHPPPPPPPPAPRNVRRRPSPPSPSGPAAPSHCADASTAPPLAQPLGLVVPLSRLGPYYLSQNQVRK